MVVTGGLVRPGRRVRLGRRRALVQRGVLRSVGQLDQLAVIRADGVRNQQKMGHLAQRAERQQARHEHGQKAQRGRSRLATSRPNVPFLRHDHGQHYHAGRFGQAVRL